MCNLLKTSVILILVVILSVAFSIQTDFLTEQKKFEKVRNSITDKQVTIEKKLKVNNLDLRNFNILMVAYKDNDELEIYAKKKTEIIYKKLISYDICYRSGQLGPKRKQGDYQVPEGFYYINIFNPTSSYYLSLGINYPNLSDKRKSKAADLGGNIFIHGSCVTIGCLPMTDDKIKEIYLYSVYAKNNGQSKIPVYIFPFKMTDQNMTTYKAKYKDNKEFIAFWSNLKIGYDTFMKENGELNISVAENGDYKY